MTVNHGVPGSSPGEGAKEESESFPLFVLGLCEKFILSEHSEPVKPRRGEQKRQAKAFLFLFLGWDGLFILGKQSLLMEAQTIERYSICEFPAGFLVISICVE